MLPTDLQEEPLPARDQDRYSAIYLSGASLRHQRLGYLIQREYPGLLGGWFTVEPTRRSRSDQLRQLRQRLMGELSVSEALATVRRTGVGPALRRLKNVAGSQLLKFDYPRVEERMFGDEVRRLRAASEIHPTPISSTKDERVRACLEEKSPYLLLAFGGPLIGTDVLDRVRGFAINQHAGISPWLKGSHTTEMALYFRRLDLIGSTVHLMDGFADAGPILRRSLATVHDGDGAAECFLSVTALGNHLMLEVIGEVLRGDDLRAHPQPPGQGATILNANLTFHRRREVRRTAARVVAEELQELRDF